MWNRYQWVWNTDGWICSNCNKPQNKDSSNDQMNWLIRTASDELRLARNIDRLQELRKSVHELAYYGVASQSGGHRVLQDLLNHRLVLGRPTVHEKLKEALIGENNQKIALDAPTRFQRILLEAEDLIGREIAKEQRVLREIVG
jgi:hypothetical protein